MEDDKPASQKLTRQERDRMIEYLAWRRGLPWNRNIIGALQLAADQHPGHTPEQIVDLVIRRRRMALESRRARKCK